MGRTMPAITFTKGELRDLVYSDAGYAVACLLELYSFQTTEEQFMKGTIEQNGQGFNGADGPILSDFVTFYRERGYLTERQLSFVRKSIPKYLGQLERRPIKRAEVHSPAAPQPISPAFAPEKGGITNDGKIVEVINGLMVIKFPYDPILVGNVKTLSNRAWNASGFYWTAPATLDNMLAVKKWGFCITGDIPDMVQEIEQKLQELDKQEKGLVPVHPIHQISEVDKILRVPGLRAILKPYQLDGVNMLEYFLIHRGQKGALLADDMGLGKTIQALAFLQLHPELRDRTASSIIICPATLKLNWEREAWKFCRFESVQVLEGRYSPDTKIYGNVLIINYDILPNKELLAHGDFCWLDTKKKVQVKKKRYIPIPYTGWVDYLNDMNPKILIADEAQYIKNEDASRSVAVKSMRNVVKHFIPLSGTPFENNPEEFFNIIHMVNEEVFPNYMAYCKRYCGATKSAFGWDFSGASNIPELHAKLTASIMIRRRKQDVLKELPPKVRSVVPLEITNRREYNYAEQELISFIKEKFGSEKAAAALNAEALVRIETLKQLAVKGKLEACERWIKDFLDSGQKLVVFTTHTWVLDHLMRVFNKVAVRVDGSITGADRQRAVDEFQENPKVRLFLGNLIAAGTGITLTAASSTCTIELGWTPGKHDQAEDRVHRIGQEADSVNAYYLLAKDTIEEEIAQLIDEKRKVMVAVMDGEDVASSSLLTELMSKYKMAA